MTEKPLTSIDTGILEQVTLPLLKDIGLYLSIHLVGTSNYFSQKRCVVLN